MKIYETVIPNGDGTYIKCAGSAKNAKEFTAMYGEGIVKPKDVTKEYFVSENEDPYRNSGTQLVEDLRRCGWGSVECEFIRALLNAELEKQSR